MPMFTISWYGRSRNFYAGFYQGGLDCLKGIIANGICTPLEVVRTRLLLQRSGRANTQYDNIYDALVTIGAEEGAAGLWAGLRFRLLWNGLLSGTILFVQRFYYTDAQKFFLDLVDAIASGSPIR